MSLPLNELGWPVETLESFGDLDRIAGPRLRCFGKPRCLFRGQADASWSLQPSMARLVRDWTIEEAIEAERLAIELFVSAAGPHVAELERTPLGIVEQWSVMQHYGVPTRTLDWSGDPYRALYFAADDRPDRDAALWFVHAESVQQWMRRRFGPKSPPNPCGPVYYWLPGAPEQLFFGDVLLGSPRKDAQEGMLSWSRRITSDHAIVIASALRESPARENVFRKVIIPAAMKPEILEALAPIKITRATMWPDPDSELARVAARVKAEIFSRGPVTPAAAR